MNLLTYQRKIAGMIKDTYSPDANDHAHLLSIAKSDNLMVTQEIITWWRQLSLERYCKLTSVALKQFGIFDIETQRFIAQWRFSPYVEELAQEFLAVLTNHELEIIACLARFETALINVTQGSDEIITVKWHHAPYEVLNAVTTGADINKIKPTGNYVTLVSRELPGLFKVCQQDQPEINDVGHKAATGLQNI